MEAGALAGIVGLGVGVAVHWLNTWLGSRTAFINESKALHEIQSGVIDSLMDRLEQVERELAECRGERQTPPG